MTSGLAATSESRACANIRPVGDCAPSCTTREGKKGVCGNPYAATIFAIALTQFTLILAAFTRSILLMISFWISASNSRDVSGIGSAPSRARRSLTAGFSSAALISLCSRSTIGVAVLLGTNTPTQKLNFDFGDPATTVVGTSGKAVARREELTASAAS